MDERLDRALGCMIGSAIGDAIGAQVEFSTRSSCDRKPVTDMVGGGPHQLKVGEWTDDTAMALLLGETLIDRKAIRIEHPTMYAWLMWYERGLGSCTGTCFDIGNTTRQALKIYKETVQHSWKVQANNAGNGGIMRMSPVGVIGWRNHSFGMRLGEMQSRLTHNTPTCNRTAQRLSIQLCRLIDTGKISAVGVIPKKSRNIVRSSGFVLDTYAAARWAFKESSTFSDTILNAVNLGEDADTVGAVAGMYAGAYYGYSKIPGEWLDKLAWHDKIYKLASELFELGKTL